MTGSLRPATPRQSARERWQSAVGRGLAYGVLLVTLLVTFLAIVLPAVLGAVPLTVLSDSMSPAMPVGSLAVVRPTMEAVDPEHLVTKTPYQIRPLNDVSGIGVGDVIVFKPRAGDPTLVMHRVRSMSSTVQASTGATRTTFTTRGDNASHDDPPVDDHKVRGLVLYSLPLLGFVNDALNTGSQAQVTTIAVVAGGYAIALQYLVRAVRASRRARTRRR